jgi:hypothetical protein
LCTSIAKPAKQWASDFPYIGCRGQIFSVFVLFLMKNNFFSVPQIVAWRVVTYSASDTSLSCIPIDCELICGIWKCSLYMRWPLESTTELISCSVQTDLVSFRRIYCTDLPFSCVLGSSLEAEVPTFACPQYPSK